MPLNIIICNLELTCKRTSASTVNHILCCLREMLLDYIVSFPLLRALVGNNIISIHIDNESFKFSTITTHLNYLYCDLHLSHLADALIQSDLQIVMMGEIELTIYNVGW
jgi:hypothetical protein